MIPVFMRQQKNGLLLLRMSTHIKDLATNGNTYKKKSEWCVHASEVGKKTYNALLTKLPILPTNSEKQVILLSLGDFVGYKNIIPPVELTNAMTQCLLSNKHNGYEETEGSISSRTAIANHFSRENNININASDVFITQGCSSALEACISALANPGQNILVPRPAFPVHELYTKPLGIKLKYYDLLPNDGWNIDIEDMESKIDRNTVAILVNNPSNPCGIVFSEDTLNQVLAVARRHYIPIISDEIYEKLAFGKRKFISLSTLSYDVPILICSSISKSFLVPGWRFGWVIIHDPKNIFTKEIRNVFVNLTSRVFGTNGLIQAAISYMIDDVPESYFEKIRSVLHENAELLYGLLLNIPGLIPIKPHATMFMMVQVRTHYFPEIKTTEEFIRRLYIEKYVHCYPGEVFGIPGFFRVSMTQPKDTLREACGRIEEFCFEYYKTPSNRG